jgi:hypothetical protein
MRRASPWSLYADMDCCRCGGSFCPLPTAALLSGLPRPPSTAPLATPASTLPRDAAPPCAPPLAAGAPSPLLPRAFAEAAPPQQHRAPARASVQLSRGVRDTRSEEAALAGAQVAAAAAAHAYSVLPTSGETDAGLPPQLQSLVPRTPCSTEA